MHSGRAGVNMTSSAQSGSEFWTHQNTSCKVQL